MAETKGQTYFLPWLCVVALAGGVLFLWASNSRKSAELSGLRAELQKVKEQYAESEQAKAEAATAHSSEMERLRKDNEDLLRLRNEVRQLRDEAQQLKSESQAQAAQASLAKSMVQQQEMQEAEKQRVVALVQQAQGQSTQRATCVDNLRRIDAAKQRWGGERLSAQGLKLLDQRQMAIEHGRVGALIPTLQDIAPYFSGLVVPSCPAGGVYTLNAVNAAPTCSIPDHALPR